MSKRTWLKNTACMILIFVLTLAAAFASAADKPNFSGTWTFNPQKSKLRSPFPITAVTFAIDHQDPRFHFGRVFIMSGKEDLFSYDLTVGGPEVVTTNPDRTLCGRLYWEGDVLIYSVRIVLKDGALSQFFYLFLDHPDDRALAGVQGPNLVLVKIRGQEGRNLLLVPFT